MEMVIEDILYIFFSPRKLGAGKKIPQFSHAHTFFDIKMVIEDLLGIFFFPRKLGAGKKIPLFSHTHPFFEISNIKVTFSGKKIRHLCPLPLNVFKVSAKIFHRLSSLEVIEDDIIGKQACGHTLPLSSLSFYLGLSASHT